MKGGRNMCEFKIQELNLVNYRRFENKTFKLNPQMNVFAGKTVLERQQYWRPPMSC